MHLRERSGRDGYGIYVQLAVAFAKTVAHRGLQRIPVQRLGLVRQIAQRTHQHARQEVLTKQSQHLADLDVGALEPAQLLHEAARLALCELGILVIRPAPHDALHDAVNRERTARAQTRQRGGQSAGQ